MSCKEILEILAEDADPALPEARRREAEAHLAGCASCRAARGRMKRLDGFLRETVPLPEPPPDFWTRQEARILRAAGAPPAGRRPRRRFLWTAGGAAAAVLLLCAGWGLVKTPDEAPPVAPPGLPSALAPPADPPRPFKRLTFASRETPPAASTTDVVPPSPFPRDLHPAAPRPLPPPETPSAILPGDPEYLDRLTQEALEVGLAESAHGRVLGLLRAADARLAELRAALGARKEAVAQELAAAYTLILREGVGAILGDPLEDATELASARQAAATYAGSTAETLARLEPEADGNLRGAIREALGATRSIAER